MALLIFCGTVSFVAGILFLFSPKTLRNLNDSFNKAIIKANISFDEQILRFRTGIGLLCLLISLLCLVAIFHIFKKYG